MDMIKKERGLQSSSKKKDRRREERKGEEEGGKTEGSKSRELSVRRTGTTGFYVLRVRRGGGRAATQLWGSSTKG